MGYVARGKGGKFAARTDKGAVAKAAVVVPQGQEFIPRDQNFPIEGGRIPAERGAKVGAKRGRFEWRDALAWALQNYRTDKVERAAALRAIALTVVDKAVGGDKDAYTEIANRLDGKAVQQMEVRSEEDRKITIVHKME